MTDFVSRIDEATTEEELLKQVDFTRMPKHIAIIMDGNRRWAKEKGYPIFLGHRQGAEAFRRVMTASRELGIKVLTVYAFSMENWRRDTTEVDYIMNLFVEYCKRESELMKNIGARFHVIGEQGPLTDTVKKAFDEIADYTKDCNDLIVNVGVNYSSRFEIFRAAIKLAEDINKGIVDPQTMKQDDFSKYLYTAGQPEPDLLIRTSGELRISNFMLWQSAYAEFWFTHLNWPDFDKRLLLQAIVDYQRRERRFGGNIEMSNAT